MICKIYAKSKQTFLLLEYVLCLMGHTVSTTQQGQKEWWKGHPECAHFKYKTKLQYFGVWRQTRIALQSSEALNPVQSHVRTASSKTITGS